MSTGLLLGLGVGLAIVGLGLALGWRLIFAPPWEIEGAKKAWRLAYTLLVSLGAFVALGAFLWVPPPIPEGLGQVSWSTDLKAAFAEGEKSGRPVLVDMGAEYCKSCKLLKDETFIDPQVVPFLTTVVPVYLDMELPENQGWWEEYSVQGLPWVGLLAPGEKTEPVWVLNDFEAPDVFADRMSQGLDYSDSGDSVTGWLSEQGLALTILLVFLAGIAASLTPCAYPSYFLIIGFLGSGGSGYTSGWGKRIGNALAIVGGMVLSYSAAGLAAALGGGAFGKIMSNPWVMAGIALLFLAIAASSLKILPAMEFAGIKGRIHKHQKATLVWALVFGLVMGLIVAPCVGPILIGILTLIASSGDATTGIVLMAVFAMGMGVLFFVVSLFSQTLREKVKFGAWNDAINTIFAILFVVAALYYFSGVIPYKKLFSVFAI